MEKIDLQKIAQNKNMTEIALDLGSGPDPDRRAGSSISVDMNRNSNPDIVYDLNNYPYPFGDSSVDSIHMSHCLEHLDDPIRFLGEAYRILKSGGVMLVKVPHFSSATSFSSLLHKHYFGVNTFRDQYAPNYKFAEESVKLHYCVYRDTLPRKFLDGILSFLANINPRFCERLWCYWVGGFSEIEVVLRKV